MMLSRGTPSVQRSERGMSNRLRVNVHSSNSTPCRPGAACLQPNSFYGGSTQSNPLRDRTNIPRRSNGQMRDLNSVLAEFESDSLGDVDMTMGAGSYSRFEQPRDSENWQPGETLPQQPGFTNTQSGNAFHDLIQIMESKIDSAFTNFSQKLQDIETRLKTLEERPPAFSSSTSPSGSSSSSDDGNKKRVRRTPPELQFQIRTIHSSFDDENKFHYDERIDSEHNRKVVESVIKEVGNQEFSDKQIRDGCRTYRKTLHEKEKEKTECSKKKMRIRSRQQRLFDRRQKAVLKKKSKRMTKMWRDITADMMTEEETGTENNYIRRRQSWRSVKFNQLIDKIDEGKSSKTLAKQRELGDNVERSPPTNAKHWMILVPEEAENDGDELSSADLDDLSDAMADSEDNN